MSGGGVISVGSEGVSGKDVGMLGVVRCGWKGCKFVRWLIECSSDGLGVSSDV